MISDRYDYALPESIEDAVTLLADSTDRYSVISGGTWVVPELSQHVRKADRVIDLRRAGLNTITAEDAKVVIGATVTYSQASADPLVPQVLRSMARGITGGVQVRNQGTLGGSACYAYPASDVPGALTGVGATMRVRSAGGRREVPIGEFFIDAFTTCLEPGELLEAIVVPADTGAGATHLKLKNSQGSWPIVTATCVAGPEGAVTSVGIGGAGRKPFVTTFAEGADDNEIASAVREQLDEPWADVLATGNYRRHVAGVMAVRAVAAARTGEHS